MAVAHVSLGAASLGVLLIAPGLAAVDPEAVGDRPIQDGPVQAGPVAPRRDPRLALARQRAYLEGSPYHAEVFEQLLASAGEAHGLEALVAELEQELAADPAARGARILLARLRAREQRIEEALALLEPLAPPDAGLHGLRARWLWVQGERRAALAAAGAGLELETERDARRALHRLRAEVHLAAGDLERGERALEAMAAEDAAGFHGRVEVAELCARLGLARAARDHYAVARELSASDPERESRVLAALGRLAELDLDGERALARYREADALLGPGHWLRRELRARILELCARAGRLTELEARYREAAEAHPAQAQQRRELARVLVAAGRADDARAVLEQAARDFPRDLDLSRQRLELLEGEAEVRELQRALRHHPREVDLGLLLCRRLLESGSAQAAAGESRRLCATAPADAELRRRCATLFAAARDGPRARALLEQALALEPHAVRRYEDLALCLADFGPREAIPALLARAGDAARAPADHSAGRCADALAELAAVHERLEDPLGAARLLRESLALEPGAAERRVELARLELDRGELDLGRRELRVVIDGTHDAALRATALDRLVGSFDGKHDMRARARVLADALESPAPARADFLLLAALHARLAEHGLAAEVLRRYVEGEPRDLAAQRLLARTLARAGRHGDALGRYEELLGLFPRRRAELLLEALPWYWKLGRAEELAVRLSELEARAVAHVDGAGAARLLALARWQRQLGRRDDCARLVERAARLEPGNFDVRRQQARVRRERGDRQGALEALLAAYPLAREGGATAVARELHELLRPLSSAPLYLAHLSQRAVANPYDRATPRLVAELHLLRDEHEQALGVLDRMLAVQLGDELALRLRARVQAERGRYAEAVADLELVGLIPGVDDEALGADLLAANLRAERSGRAIELAHSMSDAVRAAQLIEKDAHPDVAARFLEQAARRPGAPHRLWLELGRLHERRDAPREALEALLIHERLAGLQVGVAESLGGLYHRLGREDKVIEYGRRLIADLGARARAETYFRDKGLLEVYHELRTDHVRATPFHAARVLGSLEEMQERRSASRAGRGLAADMRRVSLEANRAPEGWTVADWRRRLHDHELRFYLRNTRLARARVAELRRTLDGGGEVGQDGWIEYARLLQRALRVHGADWDRLERGRAARPRCVALLEASADLAREEGRAGLAARLFGDLALLLARPAHESARREARARALERHTDALVRGQLGAARRAALGAAGVERLARATFRFHSDGRFDPKGELVFLRLPDRVAVRRAQADQLALAGEAEGARQVLRGVEPADPDAVAEWLTAFDDYLTAGLEHDAARVHDHVRAAYDRLARAGLGGVALFEQLLAAHWVEGGGALVQVGRGIDAHEWLLARGFRDQAEELCKRHAASLAREYQARFERLEARLGEGPPNDTTDQRPGDSADALSETPLRERFLATGARLTELLEGQRCRPETLAVHERLLAEAPDLRASRESAARLAEQLGRWERVIEHNRALMDADEPALGGDGSPATPRKLAQYDLPPAAFDTWMRPRVWLHRNGAAGDALREVSILRAHLELGQRDEALGILRSMLGRLVPEPRAGDPGLLAVLAGYELGALRPDFLGALHAARPRDLPTLLSYLSALAQAGRVREAREILAGIAAQGALAREQIARLEGQIDRLPRPSDGER